jgi:molecular chaperone Hsp33
VIDRLDRALHRARGLRALVVRVGDLARMCRLLHGLAPTSAHLFGEAMAAGALVAALQKGEARVNLQLECEGPLRGLFVDADPRSNLRGYVRGAGVHLPGPPGEAACDAVGDGGYLSVLRTDPRGQPWRSAVRLRREPLAETLRRWFGSSEQVETALDLAVVPRDGEPLAEVAGVLVQRLPGGEAAGVEAARRAIAAGAFREALAAGRDAAGLVEAVAGPGFEPLGAQEVAYSCGCSMERVENAVTALGADGIAELLATVGQAEVDCEFCHAHYVVGAEALRELEHRLRAREAAPG